MYPKHKFLIGKSQQTLRAYIHPKATENILSEKDFANLDPKPKLRNEGTKILIFGSPTQIAGQFVAHLQNAENTTIAKFYILPSTEDSFITLNTGIELSLFQNTSRAESSKTENEEDTTDRSVKNPIVNERKKDTPADRIIKKPVVNQTKNKNEQKRSTVYITMWKANL